MQIFFDGLLKVIDLPQQNRNYAKLLDPSEQLRPEPIYAGKLQSEFRKFDEDFEDSIKERVRRTYELMHSNQTVEFVKC